MGLESVDESEAGDKARESLWEFVLLCKYQLHFQPFCTTG